MWRLVRIFVATLAALFNLGVARADPGPPTAADVRYGTDNMQSMDIWTPHAAPGPTPLTVIFHGGGFVSGDKRPCFKAFVGMLLERGIAVACANYRLAPGAVYPAQMLDGGRAIQWLRAHHEQYNIDPSRVAVMGRSAGGGIALWLGFHADLANPASSDPVERQSSQVLAVVTANAQTTYDPETIESAYHSRNLPPWLAKFYGASSPEQLRDARFKQAEHDASPATYIHAGAPPVFAYYVAASRGDDPGTGGGASYVHSPIQGEYLLSLTIPAGVSMTLKRPNDIPGGWAGFLREATDFISAQLSAR